MMISRIRVFFFLVVCIVYSSATNPLERRFLSSLSSEYSARKAVIRTSRDLSLSISPSPGCSIHPSHPKPVDRFFSVVCPLSNVTLTYDSTESLIDRNSVDFIPLNEPIDVHLSDQQTGEVYGCICPSNITTTPLRKMKNKLLDDSCDCLDVYVIGDSHNAPLLRDIVILPLSGNPVPSFSFHPSIFYYNVDIPEYLPLLIGGIANSPVFATFNQPTVNRGATDSSEFFRFVPEEASIRTTRRSHESSHNSLQNRIEIFAVNPQQTRSTRYVIQFNPILSVDNARLSDVTILSGGVLHPSFRPHTYSYYVFCLELSVELEFKSLLPTAHILVDSKEIGQGTGRIRMRRDSYEATRYVHVDVELLNGIRERYLLMLLPYANNLLQEIEVVGAVKQFNFDPQR